MKKIAALITLAVAWPFGVAWGQLSPPNGIGVAMGHIHYVVRDVDANTKFWTALGGTPIKVGQTDAVRFPDTLVLLTQGESSGGSRGSVLNHVAFRVKSFAAIEAAGLKLERLGQTPGVGNVLSPEGEHIEVFEDTSENLVFTLDPGQNDATAQRHNHPMTVPIIAHHVHLYVPAGAELTAKAWYIRMFGGVPGKRWHYEAIDLPGINVNFSAAPESTVPTKGRMLDHLGFEVRNLEAFCKKLEAMGVKFDVAYHKSSAGVATASLTDPWGTSIELTEGLSRF